MHSGSVPLGMFWLHEEGQCVNVCLPEEADDRLLLELNEGRLELKASKMGVTELIEDTALTNYVL